MDIGFKTSKLEKTFNAESMLIKQYGKDTARQIMRRMVVLKAAPTLADVPHTPPERCHQLAGDRKGQFAVDVGQPKRLIFTPDHDPVPQRAEGGLDLTRITRIIILAVEDYH